MTPDAPAASTPTETPSPAARAFTETPAGEVAVLAPWPLVTVTVEKQTDETDGIYLHAGGQGLWVARMAAKLGRRAVLVGPFGGDSSEAIQALVAMEGIALRAVAVKGRNGGYIDDRRNGTRQRLATHAAPQLDRHEMDDLYHAALGEGLACGTLVMTGIPENEVLPVDFFRRLALDLSRNGVSVVADISGSLLEAVDSGLAVLKVSHEELIESGRAKSEDRDAIVSAMRGLRDRAGTVIVSLADKGVLGLFGNRLLFAAPPKVQVVDPSGAGDSMTAALAVARAAGLDDATALRLAVAAGAMNVTRHGRGTGNRPDILQFAERIEIEELTP